MSGPTPPPLPDELEQLLRRMHLPYMRRMAPEVLATARAQRWDPAEVLKVLLVKMAISLDEISGGRFLLGLGAGCHAPEFAAFGYPFDHRAGRFAEAVQIIAPLVRTGRVTFRGRYHIIEDAVLRLRGPSSAGPPIWIGAKGPRMLRLVARHADAWNTDWVQDPARVGKLRTRMGDACAEVGRDPATLALTAMSEIHILRPGEFPALDSRAITGTPDNIAVGCSSSLMLASTTSSCSLSRPALLASSDCSVCTS
jgi:hypothetical protein